MTTSSGWLRELKRGSMTIAAVAAMLASLWVVSDAQAGTYTARLCTEGFSPSGDKGPFERSGNDAVFALSNNCGAFNGLRVSQNAGEPGADSVTAQWIAERPDGIAVKRIAFRASGHRAGGYFPHIVGTADGDQGLDIVAGDAQLTEEFASFNVDGNLRRFGIRLICQTDGSACGANPDQPEARLKNVTYTLSDAEDPAITVTGGSMFEAPIQAGKETISFESSDGGSGVRRVIVLVDGERTAGQGADCALKDGFGLGMKPCESRFDGNVTVDTGGWRNGAHSVRVCAEDVGGDDPNRACSPTRQVVVLNGCSVNRTGPASHGQTLELGWPGKRNAAAQTRQGRARTAVATLFGPAGAPLAGTSVCFSRAIPDGPGERVIAPAAVTDARGRAAVKVRGASSRMVRASYWAGPELVLSKRIELAVSPRIRLELRPADRIELGEKMRVVALLGGKWKAERKVCFYAERPGSDRIGCDRTGPGGRARLGYEPPEAGKVKFFAKVPNQRDYPYVNGRSEVKSLKVVPGSPG
jgi:hypothetical protein